MHVLPKNIKACDYQEKHDHKSDRQTHGRTDRRQTK